jgi:predicted transcriptional regulator
VSSEGRQRAKAVPVEDIKAFILNQKGTFILTDVMSGVGGSQATVRKAVDELIEAGQVEKLGPVPDYSGRGRVPLQYSRS